MRKPTHSIRKGRQAVPAHSSPALPDDKQPWWASLMQQTRFEIQKTPSCPEPLGSHLCFDSISLCEDLAPTSGALSVFVVVGLLLFSVSSLPRPSPKKSIVQIDLEISRDETLEFPGSAGAGVISCPDYPGAWARLPQAHRCAEINGGLPAVCHTDGSANKPKNDQSFF